MLNLNKHCKRTIVLYFLNSQFPNILRLYNYVQLLVKERVINNINILYYELEKGKTADAYTSIRAAALACIWFSKYTSVIYIYMLYT